MTLSQDEAAEALRDIDKTAQKSSTAYGYRVASPHLFIWGAVWVVGYGLSALGHEWSIVWLPLAVIGSIASFWVGRRAKPKGSGHDWRFTGIFLAIFLFVAALFQVMPPRNDLQSAAFFPLLVALSYALVGIWTRGWRVLFLGAAVAALTLFGFYALPHYFLPYLAVVGGGGLILGGFWLRSL
jgi:hypothetical protein